MLPIQQKCAHILRCGSFLKQWCFMHVQLQERLRRNSCLHVTRWSTGVFLSRCWYFFFSLYFSLLLETIPDGSSFNSFLLAPFTRLLMPCEVPCQAVSTAVCRMAPAFKFTLKAAIPTAYGPKWQASLCSRRACSR